MNYFTRESLIQQLREIRDLGWVRTTRAGNDGGVGNTLEDLLGLEENNLPLPNAGEWEIKVQRADSGSLLTLFHMEPSPRSMRLVPQMLLPHYGWRHARAGTRYPDVEKSFRQTLSATARSSRGFGVTVNHAYERVEISFDQAHIDQDKHYEWLDCIEKGIGLAELDPQPYWGFDDLFHKAGTKLCKTMYAVANRKKEDGIEYFKYEKFLMLEQFRQERLIRAISSGDILIDFDARTGHNHGTKFRLRPNRYPSLYDSVQEIT